MFLSLPSSPPGPRGPSGFSLTPHISAGIILQHRVKGNTLKEKKKQAQISSLQTLTVSSSVQPHSRFVQENVPAGNVSDEKGRHLVNVTDTITRIIIRSVYFTVLNFLENFDYMFWKDGK